MAGSKILSSRRKRGSTDEKSAISSRPRQQKKIPRQQISSSLNVENTTDISLNIENNIFEHSEDEEKPSFLLPQPHPPETVSPTHPSPKTTPPPPPKPTQKSALKKRPDPIETPQPPGASLPKLLQTSHHLMSHASSSRVQTIADEHVLPSPVAVSSTLEAAHDRAHTRELVSQDLKKWNYFVSRLRTADHLTFPLRSSKDLSSGHNLAALSTALEPTTELEKRMHAVYAATGLLDSAESPQDGGREDILFQKGDEEGEGTKLSFEAMKHASTSMTTPVEDTTRPTAGYLAKLKSIMSQNVQKRKRMNQIKSRAYHRMRRRDEEKTANAALQRLHEIDPDAAALKRQQRMERLRAIERATMRHRNTSKWVRHVKKFASWDANARDAMHKDARRHEELTRKWEQEGVLRSAEYETERQVQREEEESKQTDALVDALLDGEGSDAEVGAGGRKKKGKSLTAVLGVESSSDPTQNAREGLAGMGFMRRAQQRKEMEMLREVEELEQQAMEWKNGKHGDGEEQCGSGTQNTEHDLHVTTSRTGGRKKFSRPLVDEENGNFPKSTPNTSSSNTAQNPLSSSAPQTTHSLNTTRNSAPTQQQQLISAAFAPDELLLRELEKEKTAALQSDLTPLDPQSALPGWGEWGGEAPERNRIQQARLSRLKAKQQLELRVLQAKRRDAGLEHVYLSELSENVSEKYRLNKVPYPYESEEQYNRAMRMPLGREWNTEMTVFQNTRPPVEVIPGCVIRPVDLEAGNQKKTPQTKLRR